MLFHTFVCDDSSSPKLLDAHAIRKQSEHYTPIQVIILSMSIVYVIRCYIIYRFEPLIRTSI